MRPERDPHVEGVADSPSNGEFLRYVTDSTHHTEEACSTKTRVCHSGGRNTKNAEVSTLPQRRDAAESISGVSTRSVLVSDTTNQSAQDKTERESRLPLSNAIQRDKGNDLKTRSYDRIVTAVPSTARWAQLLIVSDTQTLNRAS